MKYLSFILVSMLAVNAFADDFATQLQGEWKTRAFTAYAHHVKMVQKFQNDETTLVATIVTASPYFNFGRISERRGHFKVVGASQTVPGAFDVDITIDKIFFTFLDPQSLPKDDAGAEGCSLNGWQVNVARDVTGLACYPNPVPRAGDIERVTLMIKDGKLVGPNYWDKDAVVPGQPNRVTVLNQLMPFTKTTQRFR